MNLLGIKFNEVEGSNRRQGRRGIYRGLEFDLDLPREAAVRKVKGVVYIYRGLEYQPDFQAARKVRGLRGIYRGVAFEFLGEENLEVALQAEQVDPEAETLNHLIPPTRTDGGEIFLSERG
ncbi:MAG: hypothetical protein ACLPYB_01075 [Desulfobaccales bacterium]